MKKLWAIMIFMIGLLTIMLCATTVNAADDEGNFVIVLDPGHGGNDPGTSSSSGIIEAQVNYKLAIYAKEELEKYEGVKVYLTRYNTCPSIRERAEFARDYNADLLISLHINSGASSARGAEIWVTQDNTKVEYYEKSKEVGYKILEKISQVGLKNNGVSTRSGQPNEWYPSGVVKDYYGIIRYAMDFDIRSLLVEHCYASNSLDCEYINSDEKIKKLAIADAQGIAEAYCLEEKNTGKQSVRYFSLDKSELNLEITSENAQPVGYIYPVFTPSNAYNQNIEWHSTNSDIVRVYDGKVRGLQEGEATITAITNNNQRIAKCKVVVTKPAVALKEISTDREQIILNVDQKDKINVIFNPDNATDQTIYWSSSNSEIVRVWNGDIRGLKEGVSTITGISRAGGKTIACDVIVRDPNKKYVESINLENEYIVDENEAKDILFTYTPDDATNAEFEWSTTNPEIVRVWGNRIRGLKEGDAEVTVKTKDGTIEKKFIVKVQKGKKVDAINLEEEEYVVNVNDAQDIEFTYTPEDATNAEFEWTTDNSDVIRVWGNRFRALKVGTAQVIVRTTDGTIEKKIKVTVKGTNDKYVSSINLEKTEYTANVDEAIDIPFTYTPEDAINAEFEWTTDSPDIIRVWGNRFRALKEGTAQVIVRTTDGTIEKRIKVTIKGTNNKYVSSINLEKTEYTANVDEAIDIPFTYTPEDAINAEFEWTTDNPDVIRVWGNRFRALKEGTAQVIVRTQDGSVERRITVTVEN